MAKLHNKIIDYMRRHPMRSVIIIGILGLITLSIIVSPCIYIGGPVVGRVVDSDTGEGISCASIYYSKNPMRSRWEPRG